MALKICPDCKGTGRIIKKVTCSYCQGSGYAPPSPLYSYNNNGLPYPYNHCPVCGGEGKKPQEMTCFRCFGSGRIPDDGYKKFF